MSARFLALPALLVGVLCPAGLSQEAGAEAFAPEGRDISHYKQIWERSPFIVETVAIVQSPALATKYSLVGLVSSKSESFAFLVDKQESDPLKSRLMLSQKKPDTARNLELVSISPNRVMSNSTVVIRQGGEEATIHFDDAVLNTSGMGVQPGAPGGAMPGVSAPQPGIIGQSQPGAVNRQHGGVPMPGAPQPNRGAPGGSAVPAPPQPGQYVPPGQPSALPNSTGDQAPPTPTRRIIRPKPINVDN